MKGRQAIFLNNTIFKVHDRHWSWVTESATNIQLSDNVCTCQCQCIYIYASEAMKRRISKHRLGLALSTALWQLVLQYVDDTMLHNLVCVWATSRRAAWHSNCLKALHTLDSLCKQLSLLFSQREHCAGHFSNQTIFPLNFRSLPGPNNSHSKCGKALPSQLLQELVC